MLLLAWLWSLYFVQSAAELYIIKHPRYEDTQKHMPPEDKQTVQTASLLPVKTPSNPYNICLARQHLLGDAYSRPHQRRVGDNGFLQYANLLREVVGLCASLVLFQSLDHVLHLYGHYQCCCHHCLDHGPRDRARVGSTGLVVFYRNHGQFVAVA